MPKIKTEDLLRALEGDTPQPDTIIEAAKAIQDTAEERIPGTDDCSLTPYNKMSVLMQILAQHMHPLDLAEWLTKHAVDLEVYGLVQNAEEIRDTAKAINVPNGEMNALVQAVAADMAVNANHSAAIAYQSAVSAEMAAMKDIMYTYGDAAVTALRQCLNEIMGTTKDMPNGDVVHQAAENALIHLGTSASPTNGMAASIEAFFAMFDDSEQELAMEGAMELPKAVVEMYSIQAELKKANKALATAAANGNEEAAKKAAAAALERAKAFRQKLNSLDTGVGSYVVVKLVKNMLPCLAVGAGVKIGAHGIAAAGSKQLMGALTGRVSIGKAMATGAAGSALGVVGLINSVVGIVKLGVTGFQIIKDIQAISKSKGSEKELSYSDMNQLVQSLKKDTDALIKKYSAIAGSTSAE